MKYQHRFRKGYSTTDAVIELFNRINAMFLLKNSQWQFFYLSKVFDFINHSKLITKSHYCAVCDNASHIIENYLFNRKQYVEIINFQFNY